MSVIGTATNELVLVTDPVLAKKLITDRKRTGSDRYDEVWEGTYVMNPLPGLQHQRIATKLASILIEALDGDPDECVFAGANVSDRVDDWRLNYRGPDVAVYLPENAAVECEAHWCGGPDLAVEIGSPGDRSREKIAFYSKIGTRELWLLERSPWLLEQFTLQDGQLVTRGRSTCDQPVALASAVLPLTFRLIGGTRRPRIEVNSTTDSRRWLA